LDINKIIDKVKSKFEADEIVPAALFIVSKEDENKCGILPLNFDGEYEKEITRRKAREIILKIKPERYYFVAEAWMSKIKDVMPRDAKDKREVVHIVEYNQDMTQKVCTIPIIRINKPKLGTPEIMERKEMEIARDRWNFFLEEEE
jgi:hypothetical protein